jgi:hypothetical protein
VADPFWAKAGAQPGPNRVCADMPTPCKCHVSDTA